MKKTLEQYVEHIKQTYKAHSLQNETRYKEAYKTYKEAIRNYTHFINNELYKSYESKAAMEVDKVKSAFKQYTDAFNDYMESKTSDECYYSHAFLTYVIFINPPIINDVAANLCNAYEAYKKSIAREKYQCDASNEAYLIEDGGDNFNLTALHKQIWSTSEFNLIQNVEEQSVSAGLEEQSESTEDNVNKDASIYNEIFNFDEDNNSIETSELNEIHESNKTEYIEEEDKDEAELFCLHLLSTYLIHGTGYTPLQEVLLNFSIKMKPFPFSKEYQHNIALKCQEILKEIDKLPESTFSASNTNAQIITWGLQNKGKTLNLTNSDLYYIFITNDDKWSALAKAYELSSKESITMDCVNLTLMSDYQWETMGNAFNKYKIKVNSIHLNYGYSAHMITDIFPAVGYALKKMGIKLLDLSHNDLYIKTNIHWWSAFSSMLKTSGVQELDLSNNQLSKLSDTLWIQICQCIEASGLKSVTIRDINNSRQAILQKYLTKGNLYSGTFFQVVPKEPTKDTLCSDNINWSILDY